MSLAENRRQPFEAAAVDSSARAAVRRPVTLAPRVVAAAPKAVPAQPARREPAPAAVALVPDDSLNMLDRAAKSIVFLLGRYRQLEEHVRQLDAWSKAQIQAAESAAARWQDSAAESDRKAQHLQAALDAATARADAAETSIKRDRDALSVLQERIIAAFGFGSEAHDALASLDLD